MNMSGDSAIIQVIYIKSMTPEEEPRLCLQSITVKAEWSAEVMSLNVNRERESMEVQ